MQNPYDILGMKKGDDLDALRKRYEELKSEYGEQRFKEGEEGNEGARKLTELENAWIVILSDYEAKQAEESLGDFGKVEELIRNGKLDDAQRLMDSMSERGGKWHYYQSIIYYKRDWLTESKAQLELAIECEPNNDKYKATLQRLVNVMGNPKVDPASFGPPPMQDQQAAGNFLSNCCMAYCCSELCCNAMRCCS